MVDLVYETERLVVRDWRAEEAARAFDLYSRPEVSRWLGATPQPMTSLAQAEERVERWRTLNEQDPLTGRWAVERREDAVVVGTVILVPLPDGHGELEVGWHLHPDSWHRRYATEAAAGALARAFDQGVGEVLAVVRPANAPSRRPRGRSRVLPRTSGRKAARASESWFTSIVARAGSG